MCSELEWREAALAALLTALLEAAERSQRLAAHAMLGADVEALAQRSPQYEHYKRNLARAELQTLLMANGGFSRMQTRANVPLTKPPWPYESLSMSPGGRRDDAFVTELEYDAYQRRGDDAEGDSDRVSADEDDGFGMD